MGGPKAREEEIPKTLRKRLQKDYKHAAPRLLGTNKYTSRDRARGPRNVAGVQAVEARPTEVQLETGGGNRS